MGENARRSVVNWEALVPLEDWNEYLPILQAAKKRKIPLAITGGLAYSEYACQMRNTKDIDLLVSPEQKDEIISILVENGWSDYEKTEPYDRSWIYRGTKNGLICDIIWSLPNHRFDVDSKWVTSGPQVEIYGHWTRLISLDYLIVAKLYVFQRERCDWPDLLNVLAQSSQEINWKHVLKLVGPDAPLLGGLLNVFRWLTPKKADCIPAFVWKEVGLEPEMAREPLREENRAFLLDTRHWFGPNVGG